MRFPFFSFLQALFIFLAHPLRYLHNDHISIGVIPFSSLCHNFVTSS
jgi:hypothetical protein